MGVSKLFRNQKERIRMMHQMGPSDWSKGMSSGRGLNAKGALLTSYNDRWRKVLTETEIDTKATFIKVL